MLKMYSLCNTVPQVLTNAQCHVFIIRVSYRVTTTLKHSPVLHLLNSSPLQNLWKSPLSLLCLQFYRFHHVIAKELCSMQLFRLASSTQQYAFLIHLCLCVTLQLIPFYCPVVFHCVNVRQLNTVYLSNHLLKDILAASSFG